MGDGAFVPDVPTLYWLIAQLHSAVEHHMRVSELLTSGTDRVIRKATIASSLALAAYLNHAVGLVEAGNWPPGGIDGGDGAGEAHEAAAEDGAANSEGGPA